MAVFFQNRSGPIDSSEKFFHETSPFLRILFNAKERGELWPPAPLADAFIHKSLDRDGYQLDFRIQKEMANLFSKRFLAASAIAVVSGTDGEVWGFCCASELTPNRRRVLENLYKIKLPSIGYITEFGMVTPKHRNKGVFGHLNKQLFKWCRSKMPDFPEIYVFGESLATQKHCQMVQQKLGYIPIAERVILEGFEAGRRLGLFQITLTQGKMRSG